MNDLHRTGTNPLTDSAAFRQYFASGQKMITFHDLFVGTDCLRTCLHNIELAGVTIFSPFDIHRAAIVLLNQQGLPGQLFHFVIGQRETAGEFSRDIFNLHLLAMFLAGCIDHPDFL